MPRLLLSIEEVVAEQVVGLLMDRTTYLKICMSLVTIPMPMIAMATEITVAAL